MTNQVAWNNEMKRLETVLELAQSLDLPTEKIKEHKLNLYNFASLPCPKSVLKLSEVTYKVQKREARSTPATAIMATAVTSAVTFHNVDSDSVIDQPRFDNLVFFITEDMYYVPCGYYIGHVENTFHVFLLPYTVYRIPPYRII
jgi:hypothetical protein